MAAVLKTVEQFCSVGSNPTLSAIYDIIYLMCCIERYVFVSKICGIYKIENLCTHKVYIGASTDIHRRMIAHRSCSGNKKSHPLYEDMRKYGLDNFSFSILEECDVEELDSKEIFYISQFNSYEHGYNETKGGKGASFSVKLSDTDINHIINLLETSDVSQNKIAEMFSVGIDTISKINHGKTRCLSNRSYPIRETRIPDYKKICPVCGGRKCATSSLYRICNQRDRRKVNWPSKEELQTLIKEKSFVEIGRSYGVSDNAVRKWCKYYGLNIK